MIHLLRILPSKIDNLERNFEDSYLKGEFISRGVQIKKIWNLRSIINMI
jgi:hypothetical protein